MKKIIIKDINKRFINKQKVEVIENISLEIKNGEFISFFGPNGCGKTTLMNIISGIESPESGEVITEGEKSVGYIFQDYRESILPWKKVWENIAFPLFIAGVSKKKARIAVKNLLSSTKISLDLEAYPFSLSGGQAQMVSILRALIIKPDILIFDEPFSALDYINHLDLMMKISRLYEEKKFTVLFVSHDLDEAILLGNKVVILSNKPTRIVKIIECRIPRPRKIDCMISEDFKRIKSEILNLIEKRFYTEN